MKEGGEGVVWCDREGEGGGGSEGGGSEGGREGEVRDRGRGRQGEGRVWCGVIGRVETVVRGREGGGGSHFRTWAVIFVHGHVVSECRQLFSNMGGRPYMGGHGHWVPCHHRVMVVMVGVVVWCGCGAAVQWWWDWVVVIRSAGPSLA